MVTPNPTKNREAPPQYRPGWYVDARGTDRWWTGRGWSEYIRKTPLRRSFTFWCLVLPPLWIVLVAYVMFVQVPVAVFTGRILPWP